MRSGAHEPRKNAPSPPSGVRSRQDLGPLTEFKAPRLEFEDSDPLMHTRAGDPDPSLLAQSRGDLPITVPPAPRASGLRTFAWFVLGAGAGAVAVWLATGDVMADVYRARMWAASELRALHGGHDDTPDPAPSAVEAPQLTGAPMPTVDVERLPHVTPRPPATTVSPAFSPSTPGAPVLERAPGPR